MVPLIFLGGVASVFWLMLPKSNSPELPYSDAAVLETQRRGDIVVIALKSFQKTVGAYPADLQKLQDWSGATYESPTFGDGLWIYSLDPKSGEFRLGMRSARGWALMSFDSGRQPPGWYFSD